MFHKAIALPAAMADVAAIQNGFSDVLSGYELTREEHLLDHVDWNNAQPIPLGKVYDISINDNYGFVFTAIPNKPFMYNGDVYVQLG